MHYQELRRGQETGKAAAKFTSVPDMQQPKTLSSVFSEPPCPSAWPHVLSKLLMAKIAQGYNSSRGRSSVNSRMRRWSDTADCGSRPALRAHRLAEKNAVQAASRCSCAPPWVASSLRLAGQLRCRGATSRCGNDRCGERCSKGPAVCPCSGSQSRLAAGGGNQISPAQQALCP